MKLLNRNASSLVNECLELFPITVLQGARQVGKSRIADQAEIPANSITP